MTRRASFSRRDVLRAGSALVGASAISLKASAQSFTYQPHQRYPDPAIEILDPSFAKYRLYSSTIEQIASGMRWTEGPVYFPDGRYLLFSDIPNNRMMKYSEADGKLSVFRSPSNFSNGNTRDRQGRLLTCEHSVTRRITRTEKNDKITVLADKFEGNRIRDHRRLGRLQGRAGTGQHQRVSDRHRRQIDGRHHGSREPQWSCFFSGRREALVIEAKGTPNRSVWSYDVNTDGTVTNKAKLIDAADQGSLDGFRVDRDGNLWCGWEATAC